MVSAEITVRAVTADGDPAHVKLTPISDGCTALVIDRPGPLYLTRDELTALIVAARVALYSPPPPYPPPRRPVRAPAT